jgi:hypothetical protein
MGLASVPPVIDTADVSPVSIGDPDATVVSCEV